MPVWISLIVFDESHVSIKITIQRTLTFHPPEVFSDCTFNDLQYVTPFHFLIDGVRFLMKVDWFFCN